MDNYPDFLIYINSIILEEVSWIKIKALHEYEGPTLKLCPAKDMIMLILKLAL
jgi:hypothetical protein